MSNPNQAAKLILRPFPIKFIEADPLADRLQAILSMLADALALRMCDQTDQEDAATSCARSMLHDLLAEVRE